MPEIEKKGTGKGAHDKDTPMRTTTEDAWSRQFRPAGAAPHAASDRERLVRQVLAEVERLYERNTNPLLLTTAHRQRWGFVRALGATRLAHEFSVSRDAIVEARRLAFYRWRYWFGRYEEELWREVAQRGVDVWERNLLAYLHSRATLRQGRLGTPGGVFLAWALRSLSTVTWRTHDSPAAWRNAWLALADGAPGHAHAIGVQQHWSDRHWRRARSAVERLGPLVFLPLSQRQLLALSTWPAAHLQALRRHGQALFPTRAIALEALWPLPPLAIAAIAQERR
jgi:hypothetical protein